MRRIAWGIFLCVGVGGCQPARWSTIEQGGNGSFKPPQDRTLVVRGAAAWAFLYHWVHAGSSGTSPAVPVVDFVGNVVLACMISQRPSDGYSVAFTKIEWNQSNTQAKVFAKESPPAWDGSAIAVPTHPYAFARLTADPQDTVLFVKNGGTPIVAAETDFKELVQQDFSNRNPLSLPAAPSQHLPALNAGKCPLDGTALDLTPFMADAASNGFSAVFGLQAHFCPNDGVYWTNGATPSAAQNWSGPFHPGIYGSAAP